MLHLSVEAVQSVSSVAFVVALFAAAAILPYGAGLGHMRGWQRWTFLWLVFDAFIHLLFEGPFVYLSIFGRTVNTSRGFFASIWQEYSHADARWGVADAGVVSVEVLTVVLGGPLAACAAYYVAKNDARCHFWIAILCTAELYGDFMTFVPEWIIGSPSLDTANPLHLWLYLTLSNSIWVIVPLYLLIHSSMQTLTLISHVQAAEKRV